MTKTTKLNDFIWLIPLAIGIMFVLIAFITWSTALLALAMFCNGVSLGISLARTYIHD